MDNLWKPYITKVWLETLVVVEFVQDSSLTYALGQITSTELRNPHIERHPIQKILSVKGEANPLTKQHDTRKIEINVVPPTGTRVYLLTQEILENEIFYIGESGFLDKMGIRT